jgi:hypothetical protein
VRWKASSGWKKIDGVMDVVVLVVKTAEEEEAISYG